MQIINPIRKNSWNTCNPEFRVTSVNSCCAKGSSEKPSRSLVSWENLVVPHAVREDKPIVIPSILDKVSIDDADPLSVSWIFFIAQ